MVADIQRQMAGRELRTHDEVRETTVSIQITDGEVSIRRDGRALYTGEQVGDLQASEAELIAEPLRLQIRELTRERDTFKRQAYGENERAARLTVQVRELEKTLAESRELVNFKERTADEIDREADRLRGKVRDLMDLVRRNEEDHAAQMAAAQKRQDNLAALRDQAERDVIGLRQTIRGLGDTHQRELAAARTEADEALKDRVSRGDFERIEHQRRKLELELIEARLAGNPSTVARIDAAVDALFSLPVGRAILPVYEGQNARVMKEAIEAAREALTPFVHRDRTSQA